MEDGSFGQAQAAAKHRKQEAAVAGFETAALGRGYELIHLDGGEAFPVLHIRFLLDVQFVVHKA